MIMELKISKIPNTHYKPCDGFKRTSEVISLNNHIFLFPYDVISWFRKRSQTPKHFFQTLLTLRRLIIFFNQVVFKRSCHWR
ncbi:unnamed protein product [Lactuca virosa]|uniref:Uncharacterized protein n=1 Tax=Lactuca virosa TaxID=75947 RepID=A0AAU9NIW7_9ASTR|nr:unnamed protein product [Lactuca virosa]